MISSSRRGAFAPDSPRFAPRARLRPSLRRRGAGAETDERSSRARNAEERTSICNWCRCCTPSVQRPMPPRDFLRLTAWQKWKQYRRIPWKLIINLLLLILTTTQVLLVNIYVIPYTRANDAAWETLLSPPADASQGVDTYGFHRIFHLYRIPNFIKSLQQASDVYYNIPNTTLEYFDYFYTYDTKYNRSRIEPMKMTVVSYAAGQDIFNLSIPFDNTRIEYTYDILPGNLGPFDPKVRSGSALASYIHSLDTVHLWFHMKSYDITSHHDRTCFEWDIDMTYDFSVRGKIDVQIESLNRLCPEEASVSWFHRSLWYEISICIFLLVAILAGISQILHIRSIVRMFRIYQVVKRANTRRGIMESSPQLNIDGRVTWESLSWRHKCRFFNIWFFIASIGNLCNIVGPSLALSTQLNMQRANDVQLYALGLGCMMCWISMVQYFEGVQSYYVLVTTLRRGAPRVARYLIGVLPVFLGYALFGMAMFAQHSKKFSNLDESCVTLFSVMNGDIIHETFQDLYPPHPYISRIYIYSFMFLFMYTILNIIIAIIEDAFFASKAFQLYKDRGEPLQGETQDDPLQLLDFSPAYQRAFGEAPETVVNRAIPNPSWLQSSDVDDDDDDDTGSIIQRRTFRTSSQDEVDGAIRPGSMSASASVSGLISGSVSRAASRAALDPRPGQRSRPPSRRTSAEDAGARSRQASSRIMAEWTEEKKEQQQHKTKSTTGIGMERATAESESESLTTPLLTQWESDENGDVVPTRLPPVPSAPPGPAPASSSSISTVSVSVATQDSHAATGMLSSSSSSSSTTASSSSNSSSSAASLQLQHQLSRMQSRITSELLHSITSALDHTHTNTSQPIRPPHDPQFYPCGFNDCVYCSVRLTYQRGLCDLQQQLQRTVQQFQTSTPATQTDTNTDTHAASVIEATTRAGTGTGTASATDGSGGSGTRDRRASSSSILAHYHDPRSSHSTSRVTFFGCSSFLSTFHLCSCFCSCFTTTFIHNPEHT